MLQCEVLKPFLIHNLIRVLIFLQMGRFLYFQQFHLFTCDLRGIGFYFLLTKYSTVLTILLAYLLFDMEI